MKILSSVGVGPGDPELLTLKAVNTIQAADYVFVPRTAPGAPGVAERIAAAHLEGKHVVALRFSMKQEGRDMYRQAAKLIDDTLSVNDSGAFLTIGDPLVYSTSIYLLEEARHLGITTRIIPGIPSFVAAAATLQTPLTRRDEQCYLSDGSLPETILPQVDSVCVLKAHNLTPAALDSLTRHHFHYACVKQCSTPQEAILRDDEAILADQTYMSVLIARKKNRDRADSSQE